MTSIEKMVAEAVEDLLNEALTRELLDEIIEEKVTEKKDEIIAEAWNAIASEIEIDTEISDAIDNYVTAWLDKPW